MVQCFIKMIKCHDREHDRHASMNIMDLISMNMRCHDAMNDGPNDTSIMLANLSGYNLHGTMLRPVETMMTQISPKLLIKHVSGIYSGKCCGPSLKVPQ